MNFTARVTSRAFEVGRGLSIRRSPRIAALGLALVALGILGVFPVSLPAAAEPPLTVAQARDLIKQLQTDAAGIDQQYSDVKEQIKQGRAQLRLKQTDVRAQAEKIGEMKLQVGQIALAQFQNRSLDTAAHLFVTPDTEGFLSQISTVQKVNENQNSTLQKQKQSAHRTGAENFEGRNRKFRPGNFGPFCVDRVAYNQRNADIKDNARHDAGDAHD